ncbi:MAG: 2-dehydropantoate 2-reductase N-terminal domain-containing protein [Candidatus Borkfalkiaceae bacterium]|nr:2-dehydropantoate 2-reductase N-terminal domain-containing protein [Christensenellaceae bacterium]
MKTCVLGCGRWGSFIAWYLNGLGFPVTVWGRKESETFRALSETRKNEYVTFPDSVALSDDLEKTVREAEVVVISIKSQGLRGLAEELSRFGLKDRIYILCMKGIEEDTGKRLTEIMLDNGFSPDNVAVWVGPGHIQEFTAGKPNCMVIDGYNRDLVKRLADTFRSNLIRFYYGDDVIGSEIGAAAKNVMGIAAGILDGGGFASLKGPLMARGAREVSRLIAAMGGKELSAYGLCHLGDYETTLFSPYSNNRKYGEDLILGRKFTKLAEGVSTAKALVLLSERYRVDMPITRTVYNVVYEGKDPLSQLLGLFSRSMKTEFEV